VIAERWNSTVVSGGVLKTAMAQVGTAGTDGNRESGTWWMVVVPRVGIWLSSLDNDDDDCYPRVSWLMSDGSPTGYSP
jgi:hypothetical protein